MAALQSEMKEREVQKDHQLKEVGRGCVWGGLVQAYQPCHVLCVQVVADREALREEHEKIQRMVR